MTKKTPRLALLAALALTLSACPAREQAPHEHTGPSEGSEPPELPAALPEGPSVPAPALDEADLTAWLSARGYLSMDPHAALAAAASPLHLHPPLALRPMSGHLALQRVDLRLPTPSSAGDLLLARVWLGAERGWDLDFGFGPGSALCRRGATCDPEGRVLALRHGTLRVDMRWEGTRLVGLGPADGPGVRIDRDPQGPLGDWCFSPARRGAAAFCAARRDAATE